MPLNDITVDASTSQPITLRSQTQGDDTLRFMVLTPGEEGLHDGGDCIRARATIGRAPMDYVEVFYPLFNDSSHDHYVYGTVEAFRNDESIGPAHAWDPTQFDLTKNNAVDVYGHGGLMIHYYPPSSGSKAGFYIEVHGLSDGDVVKVQFDKLRLIGQGGEKDFEHGDPVVVIKAVSQSDSAAMPPAGDYPLCPASS